MKNKFDRGLRGFHGWGRGRPVAAGVSPATVGRRLLLLLLLLPSYFLLGASSARADNVQVINADGKPIPVKVMSGGVITEIADPHIIAVPGSTPSPSPAKALSVQGIPGAVTIPVTTTTAVATTVKSTAFEASHVLKASAGRLCSLQVFNSSVSAQYILVMDSATVPANGAVTLLCPPIYLAAGTYIQLPFPIPLSAANGISVSNSSTGTFTKTIGSADCAFTGQVQ